MYAGGSFSLLPCELIPHVAQHLDSTQDLIHFSLTNKGIHLMLLPALYAIRSNHVQRCVQDVASAVQQGLELPGILAQDLLRSYPHIPISLQVVLQAAKDVHAEAEELLLKAREGLQAALEECQKPLTRLRESSIPSVQALSIQEKHVLLLLMRLSTKEAASSSCDLHQDVVEAVERVRVLLQLVTDNYKTHFASIHLAMAN